MTWGQAPGAEVKAVPLGIQRQTLIETQVVFLRTEDIKCISEEFSIELLFIFLRLVS